MSELSFSPTRRRTRLAWVKDAREGESVAFETLHETFGLVPLASKPAPGFPPAHSASTRSSSVPPSTTPPADLPANETQGSPQNRYGVVYETAVNPSGGDNLVYKCIPLPWASAAAWRAAPETLTSAVTQLCTSSSLGDDAVAGEWPAGLLRHSEWVEVAATLTTQWFLRCRQSPCFPVLADLRLVPAAPVPNRWITRRPARVFFGPRWLDRDAHANLPADELRWRLWAALLVVRRASRAKEERVCRTLCDATAWSSVDTDDPTAATAPPTEALEDALEVHCTLQDLWAIRGQLSVRTEEGGPLWAHAATPTVPALFLGVERWDGDFSAWAAHPATTAGALESAVFHTLAALALLQRVLGAVHHDLHLHNVLVRAVADRDEDGAAYYIYRLLPDKAFAAAPPGRHRRPLPPPRPGSAGAAVAFYVPATGTLPALWDLAFLKNHACSGAAHPRLSQKKQDREATHGAFNVDPRRFLLLTERLLSRRLAATTGPRQDRSSFGRLRHNLAKAANAPTAAEALFFLFGPGAPHDFCSDAPRATARCCGEFDQSTPCLPRPGSLVGDLVDAARYARGCRTRTDTDLFGSD